MHFIPAAASCGVLRLKIKDKIAKLHKRINFQRDDFLHKLSRMYVNNFDIICIEDLDVKGMKEKGHNRGMHRSIHDASWSKFIFMLSYKAQSAGRKLIKVDPRNTTKRCSACRSIVQKDLSVRVHECPLLRILMQSRLQCFQEHTLRRDGTARSAHRVRATTPHISDASFGDEVGSRALQDAVVHV
ncbi:MAG: RNA-guided endonuclease InsQ/TnpB family protein [Methanothrix sp.]